MPTQKVQVKPAEVGDEAAMARGKKPSVLTTRQSKVFAISRAGPGGFATDNDPEKGKISRLNGQLNSQFKDNDNGAGGKVNARASTKAEEAGVVDAPKPFNPFMYRDRMSWWAVLYSAIPDAVGVSGVKYAINVGENKARRLFWILLIMAGSGLTGYQVVDRIQYYLSYPKSVDIALNYTDVLPFPAVAICNHNPYRKSLIENTAYGYLVSLFSTAPWAINFADFEPWLNGTNMTELLYELSHPKEDTILQVKWGATELSIDNFTRKFTDYGLCYTFNSGEDGNEPLYTRASGPTYGLNVIMNVQQDYYYYEERNRYSSGFFVILYDRGTEPTEAQGFSIQPGTGTSVGMELREVNNLPPPHGVCEDRELKFFSYYGLPECYSECMSDYITSQCGCKVVMLPGTAPNCDPIQYFRCGGEAYGKFLEIQSTACDCPVPCSSRQYIPNMSYSGFPSLYWADVLANVYFQDHNLSATYFTDNICSLNVFFKDMTIEQIDQIPAYDFFSLLCDVGGSLGLWLGGSVLTIFEFFDLFGHSVYVYSRRVTR